MKWRRKMEDRVRAVEAITSAQQRLHERDREEAERRLARVEAQVRALKARTA